MQIPTLLGQTELVPWLKQGICLSSPDWSSWLYCNAWEGWRLPVPGQQEGTAPARAARLRRQGTAASSFLLQHCSTQTDIWTWRAAALRQLVRQAVRHRGWGAGVRHREQCLTWARCRGAAWRSSREQAFTQAFITIQQDKSPCRLLQHFQRSPDDFSLILELLEITGGTVLSNRGLARQVLWPATPNKGSPTGAQN